MTMLVAVRLELEEVNWGMSPPIEKHDTVTNTLDSLNFFLCFVAPQSR